MPRHQAPKKDVAGCEKLRGAASELRTADIRMRELTCWESMYVYMNKIVYTGEPGELKHLSNRRKRK